MMIKASEIVKIRFIQALVVLPKTITDDSYIILSVASYA